MPGWSTLESYGPADRTLNAEGVEAIRQQLTHPQPLSSLWIPAETIEVAGQFSVTAAVAETTISLASGTNSVLVPPNTAAIQYRLNIAVMSGAGTAASLIVKHKPGGSTVVFLEAVLSGGHQSTAVLLDVNSARLTYQVGITGAPTFLWSICVTGFLRAGALI